MITLAMWLGCGTAPPSAPPAPVVPAPSTETTQRTPTYKRGPFVVTAVGEPCVVSRVDVYKNVPQPLFTVQGGCPKHCAFEDELAFCMEGDRLVRHLYTGEALTVGQHPSFPTASRVFIDPTGAPRVITAGGGSLDERQADGTVIREIPIVAPQELVVSTRAFDLDSAFVACPSLQCGRWSAPEPEVLERLGATAVTLAGPSLPLFRGEAGWMLCDTPACATPRPLPVVGEASFAVHPPMVLSHDAKGMARVHLVIPGEADRELGVVEWATFLPFDLKAP